MNFRDPLENILSRFFVPHPDKACQVCHLFAEKQKNMERLVLKNRKSFKKPFTIEQKYDMIFNNSYETRQRLRGIVLCGVSTIKI